MPPNARAMPPHSPAGVVPGLSATSSPWQRVRPGLALLGGGLVGVGLLATRDPHRHGSYGVCPLLALTGLFCPFCGGLRAVNDLTRGHFVAALSSNALLVLALPFVAVVVVLTLGSRWRDTPALTAPRWLRWAGFAVVVAFGVARNFPLGAALAP